MNDRINELAVKAGGIWCGGYVEQANGDSVYVDKQFVDGADMDVEQFAKLMIKEFETVAKQQPHYYDAPSCGWRNPINYVCRSVKEHFGVEII